MAKRRQITLTDDEASELFVGGIVGCLQMADKLGLKASTGAALMMALNNALPQLSLRGVVAAHKKLGGEVPPEAAAVLARRNQ